MAQKQFLENHKNFKGVSLEGEPLVMRTKKIGITFPEDDSEIGTGFVLPAKAVVYDVFLDVHVAEATGGTKTLDVGTDSTDGGDADGYLDGVAVDSAGLVKGTLLNTGQTLGALLHVDEDGAGAEVREFDIASDGKEITFTAGSADFAELVADIIVVYAVI